MSFLISNGGFASFGPAVGLAGAPGEDVPVRRAGQVEGPAGRNLARGGKLLCRTSLEEENLRL